MNSSVSILCNPHASGWDRCRDDLERSASERGHRLVKLDPDDKWLDQIRDTPPQRLCIFGGDGTLSKVVQKLDLEKMLERFELGLIPGGTGNDFARSIGMHGLPWQDAYATATEQPATPIDLIDIQNGSAHLIINAATAGFGGLISGEVNSADKQRWGSMAYWITAVTHLTSLPKYSLELTFQDDTHAKFEVFGLAIASGRYVGGGFPVAPEATVNDGSLDVTVVPVMPVSELLAAGVDTTFGWYHESGRIATFTARWVRVESTPPLPYSLDGETEQSDGVEFSIRPAAMRVACHAEAVGVQSPGAFQTATQSP